jgi:hypothetical protein
VFIGVSAYHFGTHAETTFERFCQIDSLINHLALCFPHPLESEVVPFTTQIFVEAKANNIQLIVLVAWMNSSGLSRYRVVTKIQSSSSILVPEILLIVIVLNLGQGGQVHQVRVGFSDESFKAATLFLTFGSPPGIILIFDLLDEDRMTACRHKSLPPLHAKPFSLPSVLLSTNHTEGGIASFLPPQSASQSLGCAVSARSVPGAYFGCLTW